MYRCLVLALLMGCAAMRKGPPRVASPADFALATPDPDQLGCSSFDSAALERRIDLRTRSRLRDGNAAELLIDGRASWERREANLATAELIVLKTFIFTDDEAGREVAETLKERVAGGATVIVQYDLKGSIGSVSEALSLYDATNTRSFLRHTRLMAELAEHGVHVVATNVPRHGRALAGWVDAREAAGGDVGGWGRGRLRFLRNFDHFDHEKYLVTGHRRDDGSVELRAIMGGLNIASEYAYGGTDRVDAGTGRGGWRDTDIELRGPVTLDVLRRALDAAEQNVDEPLPGFDRSDWEQPQQRAGDARVRFVWNQPALGNRRTVERLYRQLLFAVPEGESARLESAYFTPGKRIRRPLRGLLRRGRRVVVVTNSRESSDMGIVVTASRGVFDLLLKTSPTAALFEWQPQPGLATMHSKVASFGRCGPVIVGSANLDGQSTEHNSESVVVVYDDELRVAFDAMFEADLLASRRITAAQLSHTSWWVRWWRRGIYRLGWAFLDAGPG